MKYYAQSVFNHIREQAEKHIAHTGGDGKLIVTITSVPAPVVSKLGNRLMEYQLDRTRIKLLLKTAQDLCSEWEHSSESAVKAAYQTVVDHDWQDKLGNLTAYRNERADVGEMLLVILIGIDRIADTASLDDFHKCDTNTVWNEEMGKSFSSWAMEALTHANIAWEDDTLEHFDRVLQAVYGRGLAGIIEISSLLEQLAGNCFNHAQTGKDAEDCLLHSLSMFSLPPFAGYKFSSRRDFGSYIDSALAFFSYDQFLEDRSRQQVVKKIEKFRENNGAVMLDAKDINPFTDGNELIEGLVKYVKSNDNALRSKLLQCDFVTINDQVLEYRQPREPQPPKITVKKLSGGPIDVILTALWIALGEFKKQAKEKDTLANEKMQEIRVSSHVFKHDFIDGTREEGVFEARSYLTRLLGGVDQIFAHWFDNTQMQKLCGNAGSAQYVSELLNDAIQYQPSRVAEPHLQFSVTIKVEGWAEPYFKQFAWRLPETEDYRVADELLQRAHRDMSVMTGTCLPVFHAQYYAELMLAKDSEETCRVLLQCIKDESNIAFNLLSAKELPAHDPHLTHLLTLLNKLASAYDHFITLASKNGLHLALEDDKWIDLRRSYVAAAKALCAELDSQGCSLATLMFRSFLIVDRRPAAEGDNWVWEDYEAAGIVTILHPALLEMLQARTVYLLTSFLAIASQELRSPGTKSFRDSLWQNYIDLAAIQMPLCGLIKDSNHILDTFVRGEGLIHRIGSIGDKDSSLTTRLMLRYDATDDEDISDSDLFHESRESKLIYNIFRDYSALHPHSTDGLSVCVYQNHNIQPVIAAVDRFLADVSGIRPADSAKYIISVTVFTDSSEDTGISRWISHWKDRWEMAETQESLARYRNSHLSVAHRIVSPKDNYRQFQQLVSDGLETDIAILNQFIGAGEKGNDFEAVEPYDVTSRILKFPILEKSFCASSGPGKKLQRSRLLSNRQFSISSQHTELIARIKSRRSKDESFIILGYGDYLQWQGIVDEFHKRAEWVVVIDPNIDDRLICIKGKDAGQQREIIGFGSGVGSHGESNFTISTEQFTLADISHRLKLAIGEVYGGWQPDDYDRVVKDVLAQSRLLSGLSLIRATGGSQYIRDFMAYSLVGKLLKSKSMVLCDQLVSLDAYQHWFDSAETDTRPDLLWLIAKIDDSGKVQLEMRLLECKMARMAEAYMDKARQQLENGLQHLVSVFKPCQNHTGSEDERPDQRYWWLQLHRLIASKAEITPQNIKLTLTALEKLSEGDFDITWQAAALTFWTDRNSNEITLSDSWPFRFDDQEIKISVFSIGSEFVRTLSKVGFQGPLPWDESMLKFNAAVLKESKKSDDGAVQDDKGDGGDEPEPQIIPDSGITIIKGPSQSSDYADTGQVQSSNSAPGKVSIPARILLGESSSGAREVYWEFGHPELNNRHMIIFGSSGMGKTYTIQCLLSELGRSGQNSLIVDYTSGFADKQLEKEFTNFLNPFQHRVLREPLTINPFRRQTEIEADGTRMEDVSTTAQRVSGVFSQVYQLGDQQKSALYQSVRNALTAAGTAKISLKDLMSSLNSLTEEKGALGISAAGVISKITPFADQNPFGDEDPQGWERWFTDTKQRCHILQLAGFHQEAMRLITEFSLIDLYWFYRGRGNKDLPKVIVLDEIQNLDHREQSPMAHLLSEGRKFGFSLILATQIMSTLERDERDRLFNAGHKLFFKPTDTEVRTYADIAAIATGEKIDGWMQKLVSLNKGECYSLGPSLNTATGKLETKAIRTKIAPLAQRIVAG